MLAPGQEGPEAGEIPMCLSVEPEESGCPVMEEVLCALSLASEDSGPVPEAVPSYFLLSCITCI